VRAVLGQRNANRIADSIRKQRPNPNRAFNTRVLAFARFCDAEMNRIIPVRSKFVNPGTSRRYPSDLLLGVLGFLPAHRSA